MSKINSLIGNTKGQLDTNLAVNAILGLILAAAFFVISIIIIQGAVDGAAIVEEGDTFYNALDSVMDSIYFSIGMISLLIGISVVLIVMMLTMVMKMFRLVAG